MFFASIRIILILAKNTIASHREALYPAKQEKKIPKLLSIDINASKTRQKNYVPQTDETLVRQYAAVPVNVYR